MSVQESTLNACFSYVKSQFIRLQNRQNSGLVVKYFPFITISRQAGAGGSVICNLLREYLLKNDELMHISWTIFDRDILLALLNSDIPVGSLLPEKYYTKMELMMDEFLGIHPTKKEQIIQISRSILTLSEMGNCIIVGRGANIITAGKPSGLHIRIVASDKKRIKNIQQSVSISKKEAEKYLLSEDKNRSAYIKKVFAKNINEPQLYDIVIKTDDISNENAAEMIGSIAMKKYVFH